MSRADSWLKQAHSDYNWGLVTLKAGFYAQTCFIAQQVAEKALMALSYHKGAASIKGHGVFTLTQALKINGELEAAARTLDLYYISARYPDALPEAAVPVDFFGEEQARTAISRAKLYIEKAESEMGHGK